MADSSYCQSSFLGGEVSHAMQGRIDLKEYRTFLARCLNIIPTATGSAPRRSGTKHLATTRRGLAGRLIPFAFKASSPVMMEFTDLHMRFFNGTQLVMTNDGQNIVSISSANPAVVQTATAHGWSTANEVQFQLPDTLCPLLQNRQFLITVLSATTFSLQDDQSGANIDGATLGWVTPGTPAAVTRVLDVGTLYTTAQWQALRSVQTERMAVLLNGGAPYRLDATPGSPYPTFAWTQAQINDGPYLDPVVNSVMTPSAVSGTITFTQSGPLVNDGVGFTAADVGRTVRFFSEPPPWPGSGTGVAGDIVKFRGGYWIQQTPATTTPPGSIGDFVAPTDGTKQSSSSVMSSTATSTSPAWLPLTVLAAAAWRWGTIASVVDATHITVSNLSGNLVANTAINSWRLGVYGGPNGYPTCGTYHEGRLWLSGAIANRVDASNSNDLFNFAPTLVDGTVLDSNAIAATFNSKEVNPIFWMESDERGILCGTQGGEWLVSASAVNNPLTPRNIQAHPATHNGCANIEPRRAENTLIVVQKYKRKLMEYFADVFSGRFSAPDLTYTWKHLTKPLIEEIAYQQELIPTLWCRLANGGLVGMTYRRDSLMSSQGPTFAGGHRHALGSGWSVKSIATGSNDLGTLDALMLVALDPATNLYHVEQMTDLFEEGGIKSKAWFLDSAVRPSSATLTSVLGSPVYQLNGLWHLNNSTVAVYVGGLDCGDFVVSGGTVNVPLESDPPGLLTSTYIQESLATGGLDVLVGFPYASQGQLVRPATQQESGARNGPAPGKKRRHHRATMLVDDAAGVSWGTDFAKLRPLIFASAGGRTISSFAMFSGTYEGTVDDDYSFDSALCWEITRPFPCTVVSYGGFLQTQDK